MVERERPARDRRDAQTLADLPEEVGRPLFHKVRQATGDPLGQVDLLLLLAPARVRGEADADVFETGREGARLRCVVALVPLVRGRR